VKGGENRNGKKAEGCKEKDDQEEGKAQNLVSSYFFTQKILYSV